MSRFIFVTGGVVSSLGKGIATSSLSMLLGLCGFKVRAKKFDPYFNIDSGTMSPAEHGEVFVTEDGAETDLDIGNYERFTGNNAVGADSVTMGKIFSELLRRERAGDFLGKTVQMVPHATDIIKEFIVDGSENVDFTICEIGGTVGDIEALAFLEAIRQIRYELGVSSTFYIHITLLPYMGATNEIKTKPTQHSVKELRTVGIQPDMLLCRSGKCITKKELSKIALMCSIEPEMVISAPDVKNIYEVPIVYSRLCFDEMVLRYFGLSDVNKNMSKWEEMVNIFNNPISTIKVGIVGKYVNFGDAYISLKEALNHGGMYHKVGIDIKMINSLDVNDYNVGEVLCDVDAVIIPGGFGLEGIDGKISAIKYARENDIPFFGICLGMQLAVIEYARNILGFKNAISTEFEKFGDIFVGYMGEWINKSNKIEKRSENGNMGGTMRLGLYECNLKKDSKISAIYNYQDKVWERHRHRFEINNGYFNEFYNSGLDFSGTSSQGFVIEAMELKTHRWFIGTQFHPELSSKIFSPHPLFVSFIKAGMNFNVDRKSYSLNDNFKLKK